MITHAKTLWVFKKNVIDEIYVSSYNELVVKRVFSVFYVIERLTKFFPITDFNLVLIIGMCN